MEPRKLITRVSSPIGIPAWRPLVLLLFCMELRHPARAQSLQIPVSVNSAPLTVKQVVEHLAGNNIARAKALHAYQATRTYKVEYKGFPSDRDAEMIVDVKYQAPGSKAFTIRSATGSKLIIDKVFKKLLEAEQEALAVEAQTRAALNSDNYDFTMAAYETTPSGSMYVLKVEPRTANKFLYRGRIWVDARDFAVVRLEGEPSKNPSFWTKNSEIEQVYMKVKDFWLPARNHSITLIRLGGRAELTIEYNDYQITAADAVGDLPALEPVQSVESGRLRRPDNR
jgi:hypothetical protein